MNAGNYIDPANEYEALAERCAQDRMSGKNVAMLAVALFQMTNACRAQIECEPQDFASRVNDYAYAIAMESEPT